MCLMHGLVENEDEIKSGKVDMSKVAKRYGDWIGSPPFDIGTATKAALGPLKTTSTWNTAFHYASM